MSWSFSLTESGTVGVDGAGLYYEAAGEGDALVLIGGGASLDLRVWDGQFAEFAESFKVIRYDPRGIGRSDEPSEPFSHVADLRELLRALSIERAHLLGLSFGAIVAIDFTLEYPECVGALVVASPGLSAYHAENVEACAALAEFARAEGTAQAIRAVVEAPTMVVPDNAAARSELERLYEGNARVFESGFSFVRLMRPPRLPTIERLSQTSAPTLIITGQRDHAFIHDIASRLVAEVPGAVHVSIAGAAHMVNLERPEEFNRAVLDFLGADERAGGG